MLQSFLDTDLGNAEYALINDQTHFEEVWSVMQPKLKKYADGFLEGLSAYNGISLPQNAFAMYLKELIAKNDELHDKYHELFDLELMEEEYAEETETFKSSILAYKCDIIRYTLNSKSEALKEWKIKYRCCKSQALFDTFFNMVSFAEEYDSEMTEAAMDALDEIADCRLSEMGGDGACYQSGVVGYGIVSNILNHMYPRTFPGNYKVGIWSLYFLSEGKQTIATPTGTSEFLMVKDESHSKTGIIETEHNYFFPYETFCIYSLRIYRMLKKRIAERFRKDFPSDYRFLLTNSFYDYVASENQANIATLAGNDDIFKFNTPW